MKLIQLAAEKAERLRKQVYVSGTDIVIAISYEYRIAITRCDTAERLLHMVRHLANKSWMTTEALGYFIDVACRQSNIRMQNNA